MAIIDRWIRTRQAYRDFKDRLAARCMESPLMLLLIWTFWFRLVFLGFVLAGLTAAVMLPKFWQATPAGMPETRISGLDMVQAWSLKRTARQDLQAAEFEEAIHAWHSAVANHPGDLESLRGLLAAIVQSSSPKQHLPVAAAYSSWLLRLTGTNLADLERVVIVYDFYQISEGVQQLLQPYADRLNPKLTSIYLKSLFYTDRLPQFIQCWRQAPELLKADPELQLFYAAYQAGWGPRSEQNEWQRKLDAQQDDPRWFSLANRLQLIVSFHQQNPDRFQKSLQRLGNLQEDGLGYNLQYWRLLLAAGRKQEAIDLAENSPLVPASAAEAVMLAETYVGLDLRDEARRLLERYLQEYRDAEDLWQAYAKLLVLERRWDELKAAAVAMRQSGAAQYRLTGYSYFIEGWAEYSQQRLAWANDAFRKASENPFAHLPQVLEASAQVLKAGYPLYAKEIALQMQSPPTNQPLYFQLLFDIAASLKDADLLATAAERLWRLKPNDLTVRHNYAAALLTARLRPEEAIRHTVELLAQRPNHAATRINHSQALLLNQRNEEALQLLQSFPTNSLAPDELHSYRLALLEAHFNLRQYDLARPLERLIDTNRLFSTELQWLTTVRRQLAATAEASDKSAATNRPSAIP